MRYSKIFLSVALTLSTTFSYADLADHIRADFADLKQRRTTQPNDFDEKYRDITQVRNPVLLLNEYGKTIQSLLVKGAKDLETTELKEALTTANKILGLAGSGLGVNGIRKPKSADDRSYLQTPLEAEIRRKAVAMAEALLQISDYNFAESYLPGVDIDQADKIEIAHYRQLFIDSQLARKAIQSAKNKDPFTGINIKKELEEEARKEIQKAPKLARLFEGKTALSPTPEEIKEFTEFSQILHKGFENYAITHYKTFADDQSVKLMEEFTKDPIFSIGTAYIEEGIDKDRFPTQGGAGQHKTLEESRTRLHLSYAWYERYRQEINDLAGTPVIPEYKEGVKLQLADNDRLIEQAQQLETFIKEERYKNNLQLMQATGHTGEAATLLYTVTHQDNTNPKAVEWILKILAGEDTEFNDETEASEYLDRLLALSKYKAIQEHRKQGIKIGVSLGEIESTLATRFDKQLPREHGQHAQEQQAHA